MTKTFFVLGGNAEYYKAISKSLEFLRLVEETIVDHANKIIVPIFSDYKIEDLSSINLEKSTPIVCEDVSLGHILALNASYFFYCFKSDSEYQCYPFEIKKQKLEYFPEDFPLERYFLYNLQEKEIKTLSSIIVNSKVVDKNIVTGLGEILPFSTFFLSHPNAIPIINENSFTPGLFNRPEFLVIHPSNEVSKITARITI